MHAQPMKKQLTLRSNPFHLLNRDHTFYLNYSITLFNNNKVEKSRDMFKESEKLYADLDEEAKHAEQDVIDQRALMGRQLGITLSK